MCQHQIQAQVLPLKTQLKLLNVKLNSNLADFITEQSPSKMSLTKTLPAARLKTLTQK